VHVEKLTGMQNSSWQIEHRIDASSLRCSGSGQASGSSSSRSPASTANITPLARQIVRPNCSLENLEIISRKPSTHNDAHTTPSTISSNATLGMETRVKKQKRERRDANAGEAKIGRASCRERVLWHV
jgi:hypothetical protein